MKEDDKSETPSEAEARAGLLAAIEHNEQVYLRIMRKKVSRAEEERLGDECGEMLGRATDAYRAAVLREADRETVRLVERLLGLSRECGEHTDGCPRLYSDAACDCEIGMTHADADAWLAARGKGE